MKREEISKALGEIDPAFVEEAAAGPIREKNGVYPWLQAALPLAACLMLVLTALWFGSVDRGIVPPVQPTQGVEDGMAAPPPPGLVGGVMPERTEPREAVGTVTALDRDSRTLTLALENGAVLTAVLPESLDLTAVEEGRNLTLHWTGEVVDGALAAEQILDLIVTEKERP